MSIDADALIRGIISGDIKPAKVENKLDKEDKPLTVFDFPQFSCQIHAHFTDEEREEVALAHIVSYARKEKESLPIDNYTLAMLRHFAEESGALISSSGQSPSIHKKTRKGPWLIWIIVGILLLVIIFIRNKPHSKDKPKRLSYITLNETYITEVCAFHPGKRYRLGTDSVVLGPSGSRNKKPGYIVLCIASNGSRRAVFVPKDKIEQFFSK